MDLDRAFSGIKVLAVTRVVAAPFAAYQLALHGADVIHIENPVDGDSARRSGSNLATPFHKAGMGFEFISYNSNKRSMTLTIDKAEGQEVFRRMARQADVVIENLKGGTMTRYGIGYEDLKRINPRIIFASVTGYGQTGPKRSDPAIDGAIQAASGMMSITGTPETGPLKTGSTIVDYCTGYAAALGIATALFQRERTGSGQAIDVSMLETAMTLMLGEVVRAITTGVTPPLVGNASGKGTYVADTYQCKEGFLAIAVGQPKLRAKLWKVLGREDIPLDSRFQTDELVRSNMKALNDEITRTLSTRTAFEWEGDINKAGVAAMAVRPLHEAVNHPQLLARNFWHEFSTDQTGLPPFKAPKASYRLSDSPVEIHSPPPRLAQHTDEVLADYGFSAEEIASLHARGVVTQLIQGAATASPESDQGRRFAS